MKKLIRFAFIAALLCAAPARAQQVAIVTTPVGSINNSAGQAIAKVLVDRAKLRATVQAQAGMGLDEIAAGQGDFNLTNSFDATFFATGTGEYEGRGKQENVRIIATLMPYRVGMHVRADSALQSIADLKGKRLSSDFNAMKTIGRINDAHLATAGLSYKDVTRVPAPHVVRAAEDFKAGRVDAVFVALGSGAVKDAAASVGGVRVLEVPNTPEALKRAQALLPGAYFVVLPPNPAFDGITKPINLITFDMVMVGNAKTPDDVVYRVAKALHENKPDLVAAVPPFAAFDPKAMAKAVEGVPLHAGAAKFYREVGLLK